MKRKWQSSDDDKCTNLFVSDQDTFMHKPLNTYEIKEKPLLNIGVKQSQNVIFFRLATMRSLKHMQTRFIFKR